MRKNIKMKNKYNFVFYDISRQAGFTLIELLVVIVIVGILSTISVTTFQGYFEKARIAKIQYLEGQIETQLRISSSLDGVGLVGKWDFNEGSGNTAHNYISGGNDFIDDNIVPKWTKNTFTGDKYALKIPPFSGGVTGTFNEPLNNEFSLAYRVKFNSIGGNQQNIHFFCMAGSAQDHASFMKVGKKFRFNQYSGEGWENVFTTPDIEQLKANTWHHVLFSYSPNEAVFYFDGELVYKDENPPEFRACSNQLSRVTIARQTGNQQFDGYFDNLSIWKKAYKYH
jgi:prepilin-type N-terminal cleavage/methylation domain-containing protein